MARLPQPGGDNGNWGTILNEYLSEALKSDGTIKDNAVTANNIAPNSITSAKIATDAVGATQIADGSISEALLATDVQTKLNTPASINDGTIAKAKLVTAVQGSLDKADSALQIAPVTSVATRTGAVTLTKADVGLGNLDNTSDSNKPISASTQSALDTKAALSHSHTTSQISDATTVGRSVLTAADATVVRTVIGAGISNLAIGTTSTTAKAGDYAPTKADVGLGNVDNTSDTNKPASSAQRIAFAAIHAHKPPFWPLRPYTASSDTPTYATTDSSVGGASAAYIAMAGVPPTAWSSSKLSKFGYIQGTRTVATVNCYPNIASGHRAPTDFQAQWTPTTYFAGCIFDGTAFRFGEMIITTSNRLPFRLWVDGLYAGEFRPGTDSGSATQRYHTLTWGSRKVRQLVFQFYYNFMPSTFGSSDNNASVGPLPRLPFRCYVLGDSWIEGSGFVDSVQAASANGYMENMPSLLMAKTGWEVFNGGMGGTTPGVPSADNNGGNTTLTYNSPQRIRAIQEANPHLVLIHGTSNSDSIAAATLAGYLDDLYTKIKAAVPNAVIVHVGPQDTGGTITTARQTNHDTVVARAAANGILFVDPINEDWINGSGTWGSPVNGGNSSLYYGGTSGSDGSHLRDYEYYTDRMLSGLRNLFIT